MDLSDLIYDSVNFYYEFEKIPSKFSDTLSEKRTTLCKVITDFVIAGVKWQKNFKIYRIDSYFSATLKFQTCCFESERGISIQTVISNFSSSRSIW